MSGLPEVSPTLGIKPASIAAHAREAAAPGGHPFDTISIQSLPQDPGAGA